jgi:glutathione synthase/RimK-type ligase-like ATP-grasp enzyme
MILIWGPFTDAPLAAVMRALRRVGAAFVHLDQLAVSDTSMELEIDSKIGGWIDINGQEVALAAVHAAYIRPDNSRLLQDIGGGSEIDASALRALQLDEALLLWSDVTTAFVINRPSAMSSNSSKAYQLQLIAAHGFDVPHTLVTTDPAAVLEFRETHGEIVYKSISSVRSIVSRFRSEHAERLCDVISCPTQFQEYISGIDYRVHVIGNDVFPVQIVSDADDYRYSTSSLRAITPCEIPPSLAERCRGLATGLGLPFAGIDLRRTSDGRWYCFEVNPSPGFTFYDRAPGEPIANAVARLLAQAGTNCQD